MSIGILMGGTLNGYDQTSLIMAGVTWTLQYEWAFYACLTLMPIGALDRNAVLPFAAVIMAASLWWWHDGGPFFLAANDSIMAILLSIGMMTAALESKGLTMRRVPDIELSSAVLALVILVFVLFPNGYGLAPIAMLGVAFYLVVSGGTVFGLLTSRPARRLGDVSYGVYLLQQGYRIWPRMVRAKASDQPERFLLRRTEMLRRARLRMLRASLRRMARFSGP